MRTTARTLAAAFAVLPPAHRTMCGRGAICRARTVTVCPSDSCSSFTGIPIVFWFAMVIGCQGAAPGPPRLPAASAPAHDGASAGNDQKTWVPLRELEEDRRAPPQRGRSRGRTSGSG